jgi:hypothetical protein
MLNKGSGRRGEKYLLSVRQASDPGGRVDSIPM